MAFRGRWGNKPYVPAIQGTNIPAPQILTPGKSEKRYYDPLFPNSAKLRIKGEQPEGQKPAYTQDPFGGGGGEDQPSPVSQGVTSSIGTPSPNVGGETAGKAYTHDVAGRTAAAQDLGYQVGQGSVGGLIGTAAGLVMGVPGLGIVGQRVSDQFPTDGPRAGDAATIDASTGAVFDEAGRGFDPITGKPMQAYSSFGAWGQDVLNPEAPVTDEARALGVSEGTRAGLMTVSGEQSIQDVLDEASGAPPKEKFVSSAKNVYDVATVPDPGTVPEAPALAGADVGDKYAVSEHTPGGGGITLATGNLVTERDTGKILGSRIPEPAPAPREESSSDDSGGGK